MPRYEFSEGSSNKFWEITLKGNDVITHYGRIGTDGQSTTKSFKSSAEAEAAYNKLIAEKTKKGYAPAGGGAPAASAATKPAPAAKAKSTDAPTPASGSSALAERLEQIDKMLKETDPKAFASLKAGATDAELQPLAKTLFGGKELPADLLTFFRWHNGQSSVESLSEENNRTPMSAAESLDAWQFLSDPKSEKEGEWKNSWLPIFTNGAGDYLVYETDRERAGALIGYWHSDEDRDIEYKNLQAWTVELEGELKTTLKEMKKAPKQAKFGLDLTGTKWEKAAHPSHATLAKKPVGTAYYYRRRYFAGPTPFYRVLVKVAENLWYYAMTTEGIEQAFDKVVEAANKRRSPNSYDGYTWKRDDNQVAAEELCAKNTDSDLTDLQAKQEKWPSDHVGLYEGVVTIIQAGG